MKSENHQDVRCQRCEFLSKKTLSNHDCVIKAKFGCPGCENQFTKVESFRSHLKYDHNVRSDEIELFVANISSARAKQKNYVADYQPRRKPDELNQPKSKIFIKDVTLLRKPNLLLHNDTAIPNIFDSLDLTTTEDDLFDDFLSHDDQIFDNDFDFDESANLNNNIDCTAALNPSLTSDQQSGKIFVRKNLCNGDSSPEVLSKNDSSESLEPLTSKIYVRSHESLTSQVLITDVEHQPPETSTPDCVIVSSEIVSEAPARKIFIRNIETLTNPQQESSSEQYFSTATNVAENFLNYAPSIYVRSYDSLSSATRPDDNSPPLSTIQIPHQNCKISIKNMHSLIEPNLMQPPLINPSSMIFGQAQNLVIHMRPPTEDTILSYRDSSMTPETLPSSSNVSTCGGNDDVIVLDEGEVNEAIFNAFSGSVDIQNEIFDPSNEPIVESLLETPERNETPNDKNVMQKLEIVNDPQKSLDSCNDKEEQPMVRIPVEFNENPEKEKKKKIVKIIRIRRKGNENFNAEEISKITLSTSPQFRNIQFSFKCSQADCNQHFSSSKLLNYHKKCHNSGTFICPDCVSEEFKTILTLHTHLWRSHKIDMDLFACKLCDFKTPVLSRLKNFHAKIHSDERNFKCNFRNCEKSFKNSKQLKNHLQIHKRKLKGTKTQTSAANFETLKNISCGEFNKGESGMYIHSLEHKAEEKKFNCEICNYSTNDHNSIRRHKSKHTMIHNYQCPACDYTSIQSNTYRKHLSKAHPEIAEDFLFKCGFCKFTTISKGKYDSHLTKHCGKN